MSSRKRPGSTTHLSRATTHGRADRNLQAVTASDLAVSRVEAELSARLAASGIRVGEADLMVAATAISIGAPIATLDQRSFPRIPGISLLPVKV